MFTAEPESKDLEDSDHNVQVTPPRKFTGLRETNQRQRETIGSSCVASGSGTPKRLPKKKVTTSGTRRSETAQSSTTISGFTFRNETGNMYNSNIGVID